MHAMAHACCCSALLPADVCPRTDGVGWAMSVPSLHSGMSPGTAGTARAAAIRMPCGGAVAMRCRPASPACMLCVLCCHPLHLVPCLLLLPIPLQASSLGLQLRCTIFPRAWLRLWAH